MTSDPEENVSSVSAQDIECPLPSHVAQQVGHVHLRVLSDEGRCGETAPSVCVTADRLTFRLLHEPIARRPRADHSRHGLLVAQAADIAIAAIGWELVECVLVVLVDPLGCIAGFTEVTRGSDNVALVRPGDVLRPALLAGAGAVILAHNHPHADTPLPSEADVDLFLVMTELCDLVQIPLLDSVVVTAADAVSLRSQLALRDRSPGLHRPVR